MRRRMLLSEKQKVRAECEKKRTERISLPRFSTSPAHEGPSPVLGLSDRHEHRARGFVSSRKKMATGKSARLASSMHRVGIVSNWIHK